MTDFDYEVDRLVSLLEEINEQLENINEALKGEDYATDKEER